MKDLDCFFNFVLGNLLRTKTTHMRTLTHGLLLLALLVAPMASFGQSGVNNLDFENWSTNALMNPAPAGFEATHLGSENTTDPQNGGSALKITTSYNSTLGDTLGISAIGSFVNGFGAPYSKRPDSIGGYIRYNIPAGDTGVIYCQLTKYDAPTDSTHVVGTAATFLPPGSIGTWTNVKIGFSYDTCLTPDTIQFIMGAEANSIFGIGNSSTGGVLEADNFKLYTPAPTIDSLTVEPSLCQTAGADGSIEVHASNVDSCTQYSIDGGATWKNDSTFMGLDSGMYEVIAMGVNGSDTMMTVVDSGTTHGVDSVDVSKASCGLSDGSITIHATGGSTPYEFSVDGGAYQTDSTFSSLASGKHGYSVKDASGCVYTDSVYVGNDVNYIDKITIEHEACNMSDGMIKIQASGGGGSFDYSVDGGTNFQASNKFNGLSAGTYDVVVKETTTGCTDDSTITLNMQTAPNLNGVSITDATCGMSDGEIMVSASGGSGSLEYSSDGGSSFQSSSNLTGLSAGNYKVMVKDSNMCMDSTTATIQTKLQPVAMASSDTDSVDLAFNGTVNFTSSGSVGSNYSWDFGDGSTGSGATTSHTYSAKGTYTVTLYVTEGNCTDSAKVTIEVVNTTSIQEQKVENAELTVRPNPSKGQFKVQMSRARSGSIEVLDLTGRVVHERSLTNSDRVQLDLSGQEEGVYFVRLRNTNDATLNVGRVVLSR